MEGQPKWVATGSGRRSGGGRSLIQGFILSPKMLRQQKLTPYIYIYIHIYIYTYIYMYILFSKSSQFSVSEREFRGNW